MPAHGKAKEQIIHGFDNSGIIRCANASNAKQFISNNMKDTTYSVVKVPRDIIELMIYFVKRAVHELPYKTLAVFISASEALILIAFGASSRRHPTSIEPEFIICLIF